MPASHRSPTRFTASLTCLALCLSAPSTGTPAPADDSHARIEHTVTYLSSVGSRIAGYPGCDLAATFVEQQFQEIGLKRVRREPFEIVVPIDHGSHLELTDSGQRFELQALWPNGVRTTTIGPPGYSGALIYGGIGTWPELNGQELEGRVVLLEFNSAQRWLEMASHGAHAIIFIEPEATSTRQAGEKYANAPLHIPRFWINCRERRALRQRLIEEQELSIELHSRMDWEQRATWNILGTITGTDPELAADTIVLQAYYDGTSVVPELAPSAEVTASVVARLELARHLRRQHPARTIIFVATSAHFQAQQDIVDFLRRHARRHSGYVEQLPEPLDIDLFIGLDLSTGTDQLGLWSNTDLSKLTRFFSPFSRIIMDHASIAARQLGRDPVTALVNGVSPVKGVTWSSYMPQPLLADGQIALSSGLPALTFATVNDARLIVDSPLDDDTHPHLAGLCAHIGVGQFDHRRTRIDRAGLHLCVAG